ncbi:MAG: WXG100 family type VII secretion target [Lachnospiraceae bacterium]|nr:WXG100 family type VII secretion target [Lachnospiraceae bacterium]
MKSLTTIRMDFARAKQQASELEDIAKRLRALANGDLTDSLQTLSAAWKGDSANAYQDKGAQLKSKITASAKNLESIAATIRSVAKRTYDAEMRAYYLVKNRTHS